VVASKDDTTLARKVLQPIHSHLASKAPNHPCAERIGESHAEWWTLQPHPALATSLAHDEVHHVSETEIVGQNNLRIVGGAKWRNGSRAILLITCQKAPQRLVMFS
jgi:hypothetical protein